MLQTWIVLATFMAYIAYFVASLLLDDSAQQRAMERGIHTWALYGASFFFVAYVCTLMTHCASGAGVGGTSCATFSWLVASMVVLAVGAGVIMDMYFLAKTRRGLWDHARAAACDGMSDRQRRNA